MTEQPRITVEKIVAGGLGLGRLADGKVVMVPYVLPGEEVLVEVYKHHKSFVEANLLQVLQPSPRRVDPRCPHFERCGGCDFQHIEGHYQLAVKQRIIDELLQRTGNLKPELIEEVMQSPLASPLLYGYRQRIRLQVDPDDLKLGFYQPRSHVVEPIDACPLAKPEINSVLAQLPLNSSANALLMQAQALEVILSPDDEQVVLLYHCKGKPGTAEYDHGASLQKKLDGVKGVLFSAAGQDFHGVVVEDKAVGHQPTSINYTVRISSVGRNLALSLEAGGFCQVNMEQNENMINRMLEWADVGSDDRVLDLFCGMGNFSLPAALVAREVVGMDVQGASISSAEGNAERAGIVNCRFEKSTTLTGVKALSAGGAIFDIVLLDPPRQGCADIIPYLPALGAKKLIYISCDPATLARDLAKLAEYGYVVKRLGMVDMFPQTHHIESMTLLERG